mmetsp:Transcript_49571/g.97632  ORF Transcript_49571/g.97632 Transcript_49571/m.97632 type:complete len:236 (-) Transcript_49571:639-1346(-)
MQPDGWIIHPSTQLIPSFRMHHQCASHLQPSLNPLHSTPSHSRSSVSFFQRIRCAFFHAGRNQVGMRKSSPSRSDAGKQHESSMTPPSEREQKRKGSESKEEKINSIHSFLFLDSTGFSLDLSVDRQTMPSQSNTKEKGIKMLHLQKAASFTSLLLPLPFAFPLLLALLSSSLPLSSSRPNSGLPSYPPHSGCCCCQHSRRHCQQAAGETQSEQQQQQLWCRWSKGDRQGRACRC